MVDNQHRKISGYRDFSEDKLALINDIKGVAAIVGQIFDGRLSGIADPRWMAIAKTDLQKGFMAPIRAIAKPEGF